MITACVNAAIVGAAAGAVLALPWYGVASMALLNAALQLKVLTK